MRQTKATAPAASGGAKTRPATSKPQPEHHRPGYIVREWIDALVFAFVLAMFIKLFLVELYRIPTGSMTPTLIGGKVAWLDYDGDGREDLLLLQDGTSPLLFRDNGERLIAQGPRSATRIPTGRIHNQYDRILVNKFAYWFSPPKRGDIVVFKVPHAIWDPTKPIYIKRCVGRPGDKLSFDDQGHLTANGQLVNDPVFFQTQSYLTSFSSLDPNIERLSNVSYNESEPGRVKIEGIRVPEGQIYVFGDNTHSSLDSRYWGGVPLDNIKGRAFLRYFPLDQIKFLKGR